MSIQQAIADTVAEAVIEHLDDLDEKSGGAETQGRQTFANIIGFKAAHKLAGMEDRSYVTAEDRTKLMDHITGMSDACMDFGRLEERCPAGSESPLGEEYGEAWVNVTLTISQHGMRINQILKDASKGFGE